MVSVAAMLTIQSGVCQEVSIVLGGVAPIPWRAVEAERYLKGRRIDEARAGSTAEAAVEDARPMRDNAYKVEIARNLVKQAVMTLAS